MGQFIKILRDKIKLESSTALFFFINNKIFPITTPIGTIYKNEVDEDGFLYIEFCEESTFGGGGGEVEFMGNTTQHNTTQHLIIFSTTI